LISYPSTRRSRLRRGWTRSQSVVHSAPLACSRWPYRERSAELAGEILFAEYFSRR
jgi:hypothetical protein